MVNQQSTPFTLETAEALCICNRCPSFFHCGEPLGYCFYEQGASSCITVKRGCVCSACPIYEQAGLELDFYCIEGSERAQEDGQEVLE